MRWAEQGEGGVRWMGLRGVAGAAVLAGVVAVAAGCGSRGASGPTNTEVVGQAAGVSALAIADLPTDRATPLAAVAIPNGLLVYEGPPLDGSAGGAGARLWRYSTASGSWSDPIPTESHDVLVGVRGVVIDTTAVLFVGQQCPNPTAGASRGQLICRNGPAAAVAMVVGIGSTMTSADGVPGPVLQTFGADGSVGPSSSWVAPVVAWDGSEVLVIPRSAASATTDPVLGTPQHYDPRKDTYAAGTPQELSTRGPAVSCGRPDHAAVGVQASVEHVTVVQQGPISEVQESGRVPDVLGCSNDAAVVRAGASLELVGLSTGGSGTASVPGDAGTGPVGAYPLTPRQAVVVTSTAVGIVSTDRPLVSLATGQYLPDTLTSYGPDAYVRSAGTRVAFTHLVNRR